MEHDWAAASWLFFRVARSLRIGSDMLVARALKNSQLTCGEKTCSFGDRTLGQDAQQRYEKRHRNRVAGRVR
jgi:hypothetical protein